jgi:hypothetical protein
VRKRRSGRKDAFIGFQDAGQCGLNFLVFATEITYVGS